MATSRWNRSLVVALAALPFWIVTGCNGCKKSEPAPAPPVATAPSAPAEPPPAPASPAAPPPGPSAIAAPPVETLDAGAPAEPEPALPPPLSSLPPSPPADPQAVCVRACNKGQLCRTQRGSASACVEQCFSSFKGTAPDELRAKKLFIAQDRCADRPCKELEACVGRFVLGERLLTEAPPIEGEALRTACRSICDKERTCDPETYGSRPNPAQTCFGTCAHTLGNPDESASVQRFLMHQALKCVAKDCEAFKTCMRERSAPPE